MATLKLGILASGKGSNFSAILSAIREGRLDAEVKILISNRRRAGALGIASESGIPAIHISPRIFPDSVRYDQKIVEELEKQAVDFVVLAGYLKLLTSAFVRHYRNRILNIHPALLPAFGGQGMYGINVHQAVVKRGCKISGATVHLVDELYDHGPIIIQKSVPVYYEDAPEDLAARVLEIEHQILPEALQYFARNRVSVSGSRSNILPD